MQSGPLPSNQSSFCGKFAYVDLLCLLRSERLKTLSLLSPPLPAPRLETSGQFREVELSQSGFLGAEATCRTRFLWLRDPDARLLHRAKCLQRHLWLAHNSES